MYVVNACTQVTAGTPVFGELHKDDVILELQNCDASRLTHKQAQDMIRNAGGSMLVRVRRSARVSLLPVCWRAAKSPRRLYILCWSERSRRKLSPTLATPTTLVLTTLVAQCELSRRKIGLHLEVVGRKFSHRPGNPATVGVVRWPAAGDTAGSSLRRLNSLQHRIYNLLGNHPERCSHHTRARTYVVFVKISGES